MGGTGSAVNWSSAPEIIGMFEIKVQSAGKPFISTRSFTLHMNAASVLRKGEFVSQICFH